MSAATSRSQFEDLVALFLSDKLRDKSDIKPELEVRFGTRGVKSLTQINYDNVIRQFKSVGFKPDVAQETLKIIPEGKEFDGIRVTIHGQHNISAYCKTDKIADNIITTPKKSDLSATQTQVETNTSLDPDQELKSNVSDAIDAQTTSGGALSNERSANNRSVAAPFASFERKTRFQLDGSIVKPADFDDFGFRISLQTEEALAQEDPRVKTLLETWTNVKKTYRYINRVSLINDQLPIRLDASVVKTSKRYKRRYVPTYKFLDAKLMDQRSIYEVELEVDNTKTGTNTPYSTPETLMGVMRQNIKYVLQGIQGTNYPVSYQIQNKVMEDYLKKLVIPSSTLDKPKTVAYSRDFMGPSSATLQMRNIVPKMLDSNIPNIRENYTVTDKADGMRKLLMIADDGKIYLIDTNMSVQFTGLRSGNKKYHGSILDGEHILHGKNKNFINLYAVFDIYFVGDKDIRKLPFIPIKIAPSTSSASSNDARLPQLIAAIRNLEIEPVKGVSTPMRIEAKSFYSTSGSQSIFQACAVVLTREKDGLFEYNTDGLIFTPANLGVGADSVKDTAMPKNRKVTWRHSFKWKPPEHNTIDFLVSVDKQENGTDTIHNIFQPGTDASSATQLTQYKTLKLRVGYDEKKHGYINPCQQVIDGIGSDKASTQQANTDNSYRPVQFYPSNPADLNAGICNVVLKPGKSGVKIMLTEENEVIEDNQIIECRYDPTKDIRWRWIPLRVRYDKTAELRGGGRNFGNAYHVADSNWHSIHNPVTASMLKTGNDIPTELDDNEVYYNRNTNNNNTQALRNFHNLFVKRKLIMAVSKAGDTLIDYAAGKGGDLPKWIAAKLKFVFGLDVSKDNIENKIDGICVRYLNYMKRFTTLPHGLFALANTSVNIRDGAGILTDQGKKISEAVFGRGTKNIKEIGKVPHDIYGIAQPGFDISSIQFALHYMWENLHVLNGFLRNVSENTKIGGYFIGTCYDGNRVYRLLENKKKGETVRIMDGDDTIWSVTKQYSQVDFANNSSCVGYGIDVYQESINKVFREYLVNFAYLTRLMEDYGFVPLSTAEANSIGLPQSIGSFSELFAVLREETEKRPSTKRNYGKSLSMTSAERQISFLNQYFVYKKVRNVDNAATARRLSGETRADELSMQQETDLARDAVVATLNARASTAKKSKEESKEESKDTKPIATVLPRKRIKKKLKLVSKKSKI